MLSVNTIKNGLVIDHIRSGCGPRIFSWLGLDKANFRVALIMNVPSRKLGKKDIIKISTHMDIDLDVLGYLDPGITVNIIHDGQVTERRKLALPQRVVGVIKCKNPRCITSVEREIVHEFKLTDPAKKVYRCIYCEQKA